MMKTKRRRKRQLEAIQGEDQCCGTGINAALIPAAMRI
jgi:hypothetical protein